MRLQKAKVGSIFVVLPKKYRNHTSFYDTTLLLRKIEHLDLEHGGITTVFHMLHQILIYVNKKRRYVYKL
jgi:hypothetical protein